MQDTHSMAERIVARLRDESIDQSRRRFLARSGAAGGAIFGLAPIASAQDDSGSDGAFDDVPGTDVDVLNYALRLERLEAAFYEHALNRFSESTFVAADPLQRFSEPVRRELYSYLGTAAGHEATHVTVLTAAVELLGGDPVPAENYDFGLDSVATVLQLGSVFENTGVAAYAGAAPFIESPDLLGTALSIHSVEARHAAILNVAAGNAPFPDAFDAPQGQDEVLEAVAPFIISDDESDDS